jgi:hypothetical protein
MNSMVLRKEEIQQQQKAKWLPVAKVPTRKNFSIQSLKNTILASWNPTHYVTFHTIYGG